MPKQENEETQLFDIKKSAQMGLFIVNVLSGPHRLIHYWIGSPGPRAIDKFTWLGAFLAFPLMVAYAPPETPFQARNAYFMWTGLIGLAFIHGSVAWWSSVRRHSHEMGKAIFGRAEFLVALLVAFLASVLCGPGAGWFLLSGLVANVVQVALVRARFRRMAWVHADAMEEAEEFTRYVK